MLKERVVLGAAVVAACLLGPAAAVAALPTITITTPADDERFVVGEAVTPEFACSDPDGGTVLRCEALGAVDTTAPGAFTFTVEAEDDDAEHNSLTYDYTVAPQACDTGGAPVPFEGSAVIAVTCPSTAGTIEIVTQGTKGLASVTDDREITYAANDGATGADSFEYAVRENGQLSDPATVNVDISAADCAAIPDQTTARKTAVVLTPDCIGDAEDLALVNPPPAEAGTADINADGDLVFTPAGDFTGEAMFDYCATNAAGTCTSLHERVRIDVGPCADLGPVPAYSTPFPGIEFPAEVALDCGTLAPGDSIVVLDEPDNGTLEKSALPTSVTYTANTSYTGPDSFTYVLNDGRSDPIPATATIMVEPFEFGGGSNGGGGDPGGGGGGGGGGSGLVPDEPDTPGPGLPPLPRLPSLEAGGPGSGNIPTRFGRQTGVDLRQKAVRANRKGRFVLRFRNVNPFAVTGTLSVTGALRKNGKGKRVPALRVREPYLLLAGEKTSTVRLRLDRAGRRLLARKARLKLVARLRVRDVEGERRTVTQRFTLRAPKTPKAARKG